MANFLDELFKVLADAKAYRDSLNTEVPVEDDCDDENDVDTAVPVSVCVGDKVLIEDADKGIFYGVVSDFDEDEDGKYSRIVTDCYKRNRDGELVKRVFRTGRAVGVERKGTKIVEVLD